MRRESPAGIHSSKVETAFLVSLDRQGMAPGEAQAHLDELKLLVDTMGLQVLDSTVATLRGPSPKYLVGSGKAEELAQTAAEMNVDCIVFDDDLSPSQQRNWEALSELCVIDRHEVILDIFAESAHTREAVLQVGLARMEYSLPRLTRAWTHLSRQRGGSRGTRGEGETQLEADRRIVVRRIHKYKSELIRVSAQRETRRRMRTTVPVPTVAIVGYTNAGKSSLLNALTGSDVMVEDKLFATLDPTTRRLHIQNGSDVLLTDTVGFIRKLPHDLVDAFKSTLEEAVVSDLIVHVLDASSPEVRSHYETTLAVLEELGAGEKPSLVAFNKMDLPAAQEAAKSIAEDFPGAVFVSVHKQEGLDGIVQGIKELLFETMPVEEYTIPADRYDLAALIHRTGRVIQERYQDGATVIRAQVPPKTRGLCQSYAAK